MAFVKTFHDESQLEPILRLTATVAGADLARHTLEIASPHSAKGHATSCKSPFPLIHGGVIRG